MRPKRITFVAWLGIVLGLFTLLGSLAGFYWLSTDSEFYRSMIESWALPARVQLTLGIAEGGIFLVSGIFMLKGRQWAWLLVIALLVFQVVMYCLTSPYIKSSAWLITSAHLFFYGLYLYLLLSKPTRIYFSQHGDYSIKKGS